MTIYAPNTLQTKEYRTLKLTDGTYTAKIKDCKLSNDGTQFSIYLNYKEVVKFLNFRLDNDNSIKNLKRFCDDYKIEYAISNLENDVNGLIGKKISFNVVNNDKWENLYYAFKPSNDEIGVNSTLKEGIYIASLVNTKYEYNKNISLCWKLIENKITYFVWTNYNLQNDKGDELSIIFANDLREVTNNNTISLDEVKTLKLKAKIYISHNGKYTNAKYRYFINNEVIQKASL